jgi:hypothetical protein
MNLSIWKQFIIWKYTLSSSAVTQFLIGNFDKPSIFRWVKNFFQDYNFDFYPKSAIEKPFKEYMEYFEQPDSFERLSSSEKMSISKDLLDKFQKSLREIIKKAPETEEDFFVYKAVKPYENIPVKRDNRFRATLDISLSIEDKITVSQKPFNSTTINPKLNFDQFLDRKQKCCMLEIIIPKGINVLAISNYLHAFPFEKEILLLPDIEFKFIKEKPIGLTFYREGNPYYKIQSKPYVIGQVYESVTDYEDKGLWYPLTLYRVEITSFSPERVGGRS